MPWGEIGSLVYFVTIVAAVYPPRSGGDRRDADQVSPVRRHVGVGRHQRASTTREPYGTC